MKVVQTQALTIKSGPTESGEEVPVAGELVPVDKFSVFFSTSWILILLILILPLAFILYRKRYATLKILSPFINRLYYYGVLR